jgi:hypothetical protein
MEFVDRVTVVVVSTRDLATLSINVVQPSPEALFRSGEAFETYTDRRPDGLQCPEYDRELTPRQHIAADFLIGAQAVTDADALVAFDAGFFGSYFPDLAVRTTE